MQQVLQTLKDGHVASANVPVPNVIAGHLLIATSKSLISSGTEKMLVDFGRAGLLGKVRQQPDKAKAVLSKIKTDGFKNTLDAVRSTLEQEVPIGYCNVGRVLVVGEDVEGYKVGDRVISNGPHAGVVRVPKNLSAKVPDSVTDEEAVFTVLGAIALQGVRLSQPTLGEKFVVFGLGNIGLLAVQLLLAHGCQVLAVDMDSHRLSLAKKFGAAIVKLNDGECPINASVSFTAGRGIDGVIITAVTKSDELMHQAASICRKRGRIVLVGVVGLNLNRDDFYKKELTLQVSCSYGPGRYDAHYEQDGEDYPLAYVRWTEQRNFEAVLDMMASRRLDVNPLISKCFSIKEVEKAYEALQDKHNLGLLLEYSQEDLDHLANTTALRSPVAGPADKASCAFIGAGNYASRVLIPAFKKAGAYLDTLVSEMGVSAVIYGKRLGFLNASTDFENILEKSDINALVIATRHNLHATQTLRAIEACKHVFVEKPLCLSLEELNLIRERYSILCKTKKAPLLMVGFNRRFSPHIQKIKALIAPLIAPKHMVMTVNAGFISQDHWTQDLAIGGGRLIGEACHFVDLLRYIAGSHIVQSEIIALKNGIGRSIDDNFTITLGFGNGSCGVINYLANGHKSISKERLEIFIEGKILQLDNFKVLKGVGFKHFSKMRLRRQDKGQNACVASFLDAVLGGGVSPISPDELFEVADVCITLQKKLKNSEIASD